MPANYAHYRFGAQRLAQMEPEVRRVVKRHRQLYDIGLHGPDIFFYHNVFVQDDVVRLGYQLHHFSGKTLITRLAKHLRLEPSEPALAYLYGLLAHYCLDSHCHPMIRAVTAGGEIGHVQLETEFDRFLLVEDGKTPPSTHFTGQHLKLTDAECEVVATVYGSVTAADVKRSVNNMATVARLIATPKGGLRTAAKKTVGKRFSQYLMYDEPDPACAHLNDSLMALYNAAAADFPELERQITVYLTCGVPLGDEFAPTFG